MEVHHKMGKYGETAVEAVNLLNSGRAKSPRDAWDKAAAKIFSESLSISSQGKGCPRDAFLGLCEEGLVKGVAPGNYTSSEKNKEYAVKAVQILKNNPTSSYSQLALWKKVSGGGISHNGQMDVVLSLWKNGLI